MTQDVLEGMQRQMAEQTAAAEAAHKANVETFTRMWLGLGSDVLRLAGTMHDGEIAEAKGLAAARWNGLVGMEGQIQREEATLAIRPSRRPTQPGDDVLPDRTLKQRDAEWQDKTKYLRDSLAALKAEAATERRLLESYITKAR
jgi:hypothetical protein